MYYNKLMHTVKVVNIKQVTHDVKSITLEKLEGYKFTPGQATDVAINRPGWKNKKHSFTFTSLNNDAYLQFTIKGYPVSTNPTHEGVTEAIHQLKVGDSLLIDDPWGTIQYKKPGVFLAAGAGITPFIAIFRDLHANHKIDNNKLIFSNKTSADIILKDELEKIFKHENLVFTLTRDKDPNYEFGRIDEHLLKKYVNDFSQHFYLCGPKAFVATMKEILANLGANTQSLVFEE